MATAARTEFEKALRILGAEQQDRHRDRMVIGGLSGFVERFEAEVARLDAPPEALARAERAAALLRDYARLGVVEREQRLAAAIAALRGNSVDTPPLAPRPVAARRAASLSRPAPPPASGPRLPARPEERAVDGISTIQSRPAPVGVDLSTPLSALKGVGAQRAKLYSKLALRTVGDLLAHYPSRHHAYPPAARIADLFFQAEGSVEGTLERVEVEPLPRGLKKLKATVRDPSGTVQAHWLRHGSAHLSVKAGERIALSGKLLQQGRQLLFENPEFERADQGPIHTRGLVPVYPLTSGVTDKELRNRVHWAVSHFAGSVVDPLPETLRRAHGLLSVDEALRAVHFPRTIEAFERARRRFAFQELLTIQLVVLQRRLEWQSGGAPSLPRREEALRALASGLSFSLTAAQRRVVDEVLHDTEQPRPMTRLLQGEVGSGKTAVAAMVLLNAVANGYQGALMAPTEILAEQHFQTLCRFFEAAGPALESVLGRRPEPRLLTGSVKGRARDAAYTGVADGSLDLLVGTQALIQQGLEFNQLGVVIVDEQHRFGVKQRVHLRRRGQEEETTPHLLVMTATPIPRTLALSLYGDLDLSRLDEMPPGRREVNTVLLGGTERPLAYEKIRREAAAGRQAFIICPLVEESEVLEAKAATEEYERLQAEELSGLRLGLLHGRMKPSAKEAIMRAFRDREFDVLVSTAVVEVGVDVPNATVMLIEGAERFGLAQLHQFRGRVGRGEHASVCILLTDRPDPEGNERLSVVARSSNGLELAEHDLRLRGPGEYFGVRQSGFPALKLARLDDAGLVEAARSAATAILASDPRLARAEHAALAAHVGRFIEHVGDPS